MLVASQVTVEVNNSFFGNDLSAKGDVDFGDSWGAEEGEADGVDSSSFPVQGLSEALASVFPFNTELEAGMPFNKWARDFSISLSLPVPNGPEAQSIL